jgi:phosphoenolpyruvate---glycerone phosphotransferase subunit DhaL
MNLEPTLQRKLIQAVANQVIQHADELVALDQAVGDGDHGLNMKRGFEAVLADADKISALPTPEALKAMGMALVMKVGGASGPLYGTLFMAMGKGLPDQATLVGISDAFAAAIDAVKARGKSDVGAKTMLDVLVPLSAVMRQGGAELPGRLRACASAAATATVPMKATRGRASFLGERSIGHMDPGARSSELIVHAILEVLEQEEIV